VISESPATGVSEPIVESPAVLETAQVESPVDLTPPEEASLAEAEASASVPDSPAPSDLPGVPDQAVGESNDNPPKFTFQILCLSFRSYAPSSRSLCCWSIRKRRAARSTLSSRA
jgi:hypothetical protein